MRAVRVVKRSEGRKVRAMTESKRVPIKVREQVGMRIDLSLLMQTPRVSKKAHGVQVVVRR